jgi:heparanase 1
MRDRRQPPETSPPGFAEEDKVRDIIVALALGAVVAAAPPPAWGQPKHLTTIMRISPRDMPRVATIDDRYQSYNVEMAEVIGGNFWKPYDAQSVARLEALSKVPPRQGSAIAVGQDSTMFQKRAPIDLANSRLRTLAAALGPAYVRVSGTWANSVYFHDADTPAPAAPPTGYEGVLTREAWKAVVDFTRAANASLVTSFTISSGVRDANGIWTAVEAKPFVTYTQAVGGRIAAAELFNEPTMPTYGAAPPGYDAATFAKDVAAFRAFVKSNVPGMLIVGPGGVGEGLPTGLLPADAAGSLLPTPALLAASPRPAFDVFSYHFYGAASIRCAAMGPGSQTTADAALSEAFLARTDTVYSYYAQLRDRYEPGRPIWITETADAACGGNPWASTFLDTFRYLDQLGRLAKRGVAVVFHNTLAASEYGLLDQHDFSPRPNYWAALLWRRLMGPTVLDAGSSRGDLHLYANCLRGHPGGVAVLAINLSRTQSEELDVPIAAQRYTLSSPQLKGGSLQLNGTTLTLGPGDELPQLRGVATPAGRLSLAPTTITFLAFDNADGTNCR